MIGETVMNVLILAGSNRKNSTSTKLCRYIERILRGKGCDVTFFDLYRQPLPFYCPDDDPQDDANLTALKNAITRANAVVLSTPEYHGSMSGVLKNALDHLGSEHFEGKVVLSVSSAGGAVGVSSLQQLQAVVRYVHGINCPEWISIGGENRQFDAQGEPLHPKQKERVARAIDCFLKMARSFPGATA
mgnify:FL=1